MVIEDQSDADNFVISARLPCVWDSSAKTVFLLVAGFLNKKLASVVPRSDDRWRVYVYLDKVYEASSFPYRRSVGNKACSDARASAV